MDTGRERMYDADRCALHTVCVAEAGHLLIRLGKAPLKLVCPRYGLLYLLFQAVVAFALDMALAPRRLQLHLCGGCCADGCLSCSPLPRARCFGMHEPLLNPSHLAPQVPTATPPHPHSHHSPLPSMHHCPST